ncbi:MAG TPA: hypothetical protein VND87_12160 [Stellaceae bacterium]|nr:hypothetical protein [Stellaceae bacterium]
MANEVAARAATLIRMLRDANPKLAAELSGMPVRERGDRLYSGDELRETADGMTSLDTMMRSAGCASDEFSALLDRFFERGDAVSLFFISQNLLRRAESVLLSHGAAEGRA